uniref:Uncharacterized protein n=1 Tax=Hyaloperonospora arabidopsidis (strain Emoy2) TaxID=559515 RepID=M4BKE4_HYAAE
MLGTSQLGIFPVYSIMKTICRCQKEKYFSSTSTQHNIFPVLPRSLFSTLWENINLGTEAHEFGILCSENENINVDEYPTIP